MARAGDRIGSWDGRRSYEVGDDGSALVPKVAVAVVMVYTAGACVDSSQSFGFLLTCNAHFTLVAAIQAIALFESNAD